MDANKDLIISNERVGQLVEILEKINMKPNEIETIKNNKVKGLNIFKSTLVFLKYLH